MGFLNNRFISVKKAIIIDDQKKSVVETCPFCMSICQSSSVSIDPPLGGKFYQSVKYMQSETIVAVSTAI